MDEFDAEVLCALFELDKTTSWVSSSKIAKHMDLPKDRKNEVETSLEAGITPGFVKKNNSLAEGYKITSDGANFVTQKNLQDSLEKSINDLDRSIRKLHRQQARSSAAETIFTLALLGFAAVQILPNYNSKIVIVAAAIATFWALLIGGKNLAQVTVDQLERPGDYLLDKLGG